MFQYWYMFQYWKMVQYFSPAPTPEPRASQTKLRWQASQTKAKHIATNNNDRDPTLVLVAGVASGVFFAPKFELL